MWPITRKNSSDEREDITSPLNVGSDRIYRAVNDNDDDGGESDMNRESQGRSLDSSYREFEAWSSSQLGFSNFESWVHSRRAVVIVSIAAVLFLGFAVVGYSFLFEDWEVTDSIYVAVVMFATVGYGDYCPSNHASKLFTVFIGIFGITILGILLGMLTEYFSDRQEKKIEERLENARLKVMEQFSEMDTAEPTKRRSILGDAYLMIVYFGPLFLLAFACAAPVIYIEQWDLIEGIYWMFITGTTIGFGDDYPTKTSSKMFAILYIFIGVAVFGRFLAYVAEAYIERQNEKVEDKFLNRAMTLGDLERMDANKNGKVEREEFLRYMLVALQKVDKKDVDEIMELFEKLDKDGNGSIEKSDLKAHYQLSIAPGCVHTQ